VSRLKPRPTNILCFFRRLLNLSAFLIRDWADQKNKAYGLLRL